MPDLFDNAIARRTTFGANANGAALHVAFGVDAAYARPAGIAITSLLAHNPRMAFVFHVFANSMGSADRKRFEELARRHETAVELYDVDTRAFARLPTTAQYSLAMYNRLLVPRALRGRAQRVLYLDADILCIAPLDELVATDFAGAVSLVAQDRELSAGQSAALGLKDERYFNSGMMHIDVDRWLERDVSGRCVELLVEQPRFRWADQDALNLLLDGEARFVDERWNVQCNLYAAMKAIPFDGSPAPPYTLPDGAALLHFTGRAKPWHRWCVHSVASVYHEQARDSLWRDCALVASPPSYHEMKMLSHCFLREGRKVHATYWYAR
jgi:UDP-glucose:(glucosyl)LPS alpha-1,3-glucosyltransferase